MPHAVKTAVSLPREDFQHLEAIRKRTHQSRSKILLEALHAWLRLKEQEMLEQRYVAGYQRHPEALGDLEAFYTVGLASFSKGRRTIIRRSKGRW